MARHSLPIPYKERTFGRNRLVVKGTLLEKLKQFSSICLLDLERCDRNDSRVTLSACSTSACLAEMVGNEGQFTCDDERVFCPYLASLWSGVTEMSVLSVAALYLQVV